MEARATPIEGADTEPFRKEASRMNAIAKGEVFPCIATFLIRVQPWVDRDIGQKTI